LRRSTQPPRIHKRYRIIFHNNPVVHPQPDTRIAFKISWLA
jgi:hypothetical protein